jgi:hypothetical protein
LITISDKKKKLEEEFGDYFIVVVLGPLSFDVVVLGPLSFDVVVVLGDLDDFLFLLIMLLLSFKKKKLFFLRK